MNPDQLADPADRYQSPVFVTRQDHRSPHLSAGVRECCSLRDHLYEELGVLFVVTSVSQVGDTYQRWLSEINSLPLADITIVRHQ